MRSGTTTPPAQRIWTVEVRPGPGGAVVVCPDCGQTTSGAALRKAVVAHLAQHARVEALAQHWRICQCGEHGCRWHPRHRGCDGQVRLLLTREHAGRMWRLADVCHACATVTEHAAEVQEPLCTSQPMPPRSRPSSLPRRRGGLTTTSPGHTVPGDRERADYQWSDPLEGLLWADDLAQG
ncbi:hypothetical protein [Streptomyces roseoverticillatus]|uniref:hypothetical protein n=1 Tax=Streptomyces roseoverticillatus TaxID=66429 RepID=UPI0006932EEF|nr:hypothetical protein [Streptomyces roseoverticillatus]